MTPSGSGASESVPAAGRLCTDDWVSASKALLEKAHSSLGKKKD